MSITRDRLVDDNTSYDAYTCGICQNVLQDPTVVCSNAHIYCIKCIKDRDDNSLSNCSSCQSPIEIDSLKVSEGWRKMVQGLRITCVFKPQGCTWEGKIVEEPAHQHQCQFQVILESCSNANCPERLTADERNDHLSKCQYTRRECSNACGAVIALCDIDQHKQFCPKQKITCPRGAAACSKYNRDRVQFHEAKCCYWSCDNKRFGCPTIGTRDSLTKIHIPYCTLLHQQVQALQAGIASAKQERDLSIMHFTRDANKRYTSLLEEFENRTAAFNLNYGALKKIEEAATLEVIDLRRQLDEVSGEKSGEVKDEMKGELKEEFESLDWSDKKRVLDLDEVEGHDENENVDEVQSRKKPKVEVED